MASRLREFTRVNLPVYTGSKITEDLEEEFRAAMHHDSMDLPMLMVHVHHVKIEEGRGSTLGQGIGQGKLRINFQGRVEQK